MKCRGKHDLKRVVLQSFSLLHECSTTGFTTDQSTVMLALSGGVTTTGGSDTIENVANTSLAGCTRGSEWGGGGGGGWRRGVRM